MKDIIEIAKQRPPLKRLLGLSLVTIVAWTLITYIAFAIRGYVAVPQILLLGPIQLRTYSLTAISGIITAVVLIIYFKKELPSLKNFDVMDNLIWVLVTGLVGARLYHVITDYHLYADQPILILAIQNGGLGIIGGITGGIVGLWWVANRNKVPSLDVLTVVALVMPLAQAIGRLGNLFNRELYGLPTDLPWGLYVEPIFRVAGYYQNSYFHPLFLYEALANLILFGLLLYIWKSGGYQTELKRNWMVIQSYVMGYGLIRFGLDFLRVEGNTGLAGLSYTQWLLIALLVCYFVYRIFNLLRDGTKIKGINRR